MKTVWKFTLLHPSWAGTLQIPVGAKFIHFDFQYKNPTLWFLVDSEAPKEERRFEVIGTGHEVPENAEHLASVQVLTELYWVWHLFELKS